MVRAILKERLRYGYVEGGPYERNKKTTFEKLTLEQRDQIRDKVIPDCLCNHPSLHSFTFIHNHLYSIHNH